MGTRDPFTAVAPRPRFDWSLLRDQVDMAVVAEALLGQPHRQESGRLLWLCPIHAERTPSFTVQPGRRNWKCWGCGEQGDAADLVGKLEHLTFPHSARRAAEIAGVLLPDGGFTPPRPRPSQPPPQPPQPSGLPGTDATRLVDEAAARLWTDAGREALEYLRGPRGLHDDSIRAARLGWTPPVAVPTRDGKVYRPSGVTIPWFDKGRLAMVKIRQGPGARMKYAEVFRDRPVAFPSLDAIRPGLPLIVCEGEFDAVLLNQEVGDMAAVVTVGSASTALTPGLLRSLLPATPWFIAVDADQAGDKFADGWPARAERVRPFGGEKDWTDLHATGRNRIRYHWLPLLGFKAKWEDLEPQRWGPGLLPDHVLDAMDSAAVAASSRVA
ncbi:CHC2 zinc finger domain-containing protein [Paludisphaera sp.]|uniref:CHC2 zinc finger domain-containing protein n=1 Tax=Paludisphaera sp. TaxID=2017432 RepID=UPI00301C93CF